VCRKKKKKEKKKKKRKDLFAHKFIKNEGCYITFLSFRKRKVKVKIARHYIRASCLLTPNNNNNKIKKIRKEQHSIDRENDI